MGMFDYRGKRVVVTGCFSGMGAATARRLLDMGAEVHGLDYKDVDLPLASCTKVDLRDTAAIDAAAGEIGGKIGKIDALFNCAGLPPATFSGTEVMKVNYLGTRRLTERLLPAMGEGSAICSISSTAGLGYLQRMPLLFELLQIADYDQALAWIEEHPDAVAEGYSFSKELIIVWTMMMGVPLIQQGIRINCTLPGPTQTPMMNEFESATPKTIIDASAQPINRRATPDEQASAVVFLNSDAASYINGVALPVDGGFVGGTMTGQISMQKALEEAGLVAPTA